MTIVILAVPPVLAFEGMALLTLLLVVIRSRLAGSRQLTS